MVGFNRRFSPLAARLREELAGVGPLVLAYRVNAGALPAGHWLAGPEEGGRIVGEACHFVDLATFLTRSVPVRVFAAAPAGAAEPASMLVSFADGSVLALTYAVIGSRRLSKERLEVFGGGRAWVLEDWQRSDQLRSRPDPAGPPVGAGPGSPGRAGGLPRRRPEPVVRSRSRSPSWPARPGATFAPSSRCDGARPVEVPHEL